MRNLKKFLALVLAMMMTFSLMVVANAKDITADFTDAASVTEEFQEGVDVLSGMKVFEGYEDGSFKPKNNITRAEVATIVYRLATGDWEGTQAHLYKDYQKFDDVKSDHWAAGYINYCANAEWIAGYGNGKFGPNDQVTGYQAAAMILRAVGYGKNGEFVGSTWRVQVANVTRSKGLLVNVDNTNYANTLNNAATRELVAEILFQAAQIPTVTWTMLNGYNEYPVALPTEDTAKNDSLGQINYGLTWDYGIVVANQETRRQDVPGNKTTVLSISTGLNAAGDEVVTTHGSYNNAAVTATGNAETTRGSFTLNFDVVTGLEDFGHLKKVWYNYNGSTHKTYAIYDKSVKSDLVLSTHTDGDELDDMTDPNTLSGIAANMGYTVPAAGAYGSNAFGPFWDNPAPATDNIADRTGAMDPSPSYLYALISNGKDAATGKPRLDAVVSLNVEASKVIAVNNNVTATNKTVTVGEGYKGADNTAIAGNTTSAIGTVVAPGSGTVGHLPIFQNALSANSTTTLGDFVINNALGSITAGAATAYNVAKLAEPKTGKVVSYYNGTDPNTDPDYVMLDDGTKLVKSPLYTVVVQNDGTDAASTGKWNTWPTVRNNWSGKTTVIPQAATNASGADYYNNGTYEFYIGPDGKYVGSKEILSTGLIYGTYMDYTQETSSSTFKYYLTGIDENGNQVTKQVETVTSPSGTTTQTIDSTNHGYIKVPFRDSDSNNKLGTGNYKLFTLSGTALSRQLTVPGYATTGDLDAVTIGKTEKILGTVEAQASSNTYFTEKTKFILVEGYGTDSAKAEVYNGISELLGNNKEVKIHLESSDTIGGWKTAHPGNNALAGIAGSTTKMNTMAFWKTSPFIYDQNHTPTAQQADVIFLPKAAVEFSGTNSLYYVGNNTPTLVTANTGEHATQFTMYDTNGNEGKYWVDGWATDTTKSAYLISTTDPGDRFYELSDSGKKTNSGETIYTAVAASKGTDGVYYDATSHRANDGIIMRDGTGLGIYVASTDNAQNAQIFTDSLAIADGVTYRVAGAKVVNLSDKGSATTLGTRYPGITDLATLNGTSSVSSTSSGGNMTGGVHIAAVVADDGLTITTIFVCYNQQNS